MIANDFHFTSDIPPDSVIALGDVHGQYDLLVQFLNWVKGSDARVVLLGDLVDRAKYSGDDLHVLHEVQELCEDSEGWGLASFTCIQGNHERLLINAVDGYGYSDWVSNGGDWENLNELAKYRDFLDALPYYVTVGGTLFTHSGGIFGKNPADSMTSLHNREQFVWSRSAYREGSGLNLWSKTLTKSVFGHSPRSKKAYRVGDAICIDTAAFHTGTLTAYNSTYNTFMSFDAE
jgi:hypothetical protein